MSGTTVNNKAARTGLEIAVPLVLVTAWWVASASANNPFFPPLGVILKRFQELWLFDHLVSDIVPSVLSLALGFGIAAVAGVFLGLVLGAYKPIREMFIPLINFCRSVPAVAVIPIFMVLLGFGEGTRLLIIVLAATPPTLIATLDGVRNVDSLLKDVGKVFRMSTMEKIMGIYLPAASPQIFSGLQVSLQFSFIVMIASEMLGSSRGIGAMTLIAQQTFASVDMWAGILLLGVVGYLSNMLLVFARKRVLRWYDGAKQSERAF